MTGFPVGSVWQNHSNSLSFRCDYPGKAHVKRPGGLTRKTNGPQRPSSTGERHLTAQCPQPTQSSSCSEAGTYDWNTPTWGKFGNSLKHARQTSFSQSISLISDLANHAQLLDTQQIPFPIPSWCFLFTLPCENTLKTQSSKSHYSTEFRFDLKWLVSSVLVRRKSCDIYSTVCVYLET